MLVTIFTRVGTSSVAHYVGISHELIAMERDAWIDLFLPANGHSSVVVDINDNCPDKTNAAPTEVNNGGSGNLCGLLPEG